MKKIFKRGMAGLLAVLMAFTMLVGFGTTTAFAASETAESYMISFPRDGDAAQIYSADAWGHSAKNYMNGWTTGSSNYTTLHCMDSFDGKVCYCIEPGLSRNVGDTYYGFGEDFWDNYPSQYNNTIQPDDIKLLLGRIMQYGYQGNLSTSWRSQNDSDADKLAHAFATQLLVWETVVGERDADFDHVSTGGYDEILSLVSPNHPLYSRIMDYYDSIESSVQSHAVCPSFMSRSSGGVKSIELAWDGSQYIAELTDTNRVLSQFTFSASETGFHFSVSGNTLKGRGDGTLNLQINPRSNVFEMYGDYTITEGSFLFSLQNIINKRFVIENGSTIQWTGSPMDAMLDINAIYKLKASLQPLLQGTSDNLAADRSVPVECVIHLGERLSNPAVTFDVHVPGTDPETQTVIANALTTPETVDTQFAYLLLFNSFMGENSSSSSNIGTSVSAATGLEFVSNMVSNLLSNDDYNIVIRYRPKSELTSDEVDFGLSKSLINNRLFVEVEGNYLIDNKQAVNSSMSNFMGEAYITYLIDRAGTLKAKAFTQTIDRFDENQGLQETGIGIYFKEDFNNFRDLRRRIRERFTNKKRKARREARRQAAREEKERLRQPADTLSALRPVMDKKDENN